MEDLVQIQVSKMKSPIGWMYEIIRDGKYESKFSGIKTTGEQYFDYIEWCNKMDLTPFSKIGWMRTLVVFNKGSTNKMVHSRQKHVKGKNIKIFCIITKEECTKVYNTVYNLNMFSKDTNSHMIPKQKIKDKSIENFYIVPAPKRECIHILREAKVILNNRLENTVLPPNVLKPSSFSNKTRMELRKIFNYTCAMCDEYVGEYGQCAHIISASKHKKGPRHYTDIYGDIDRASARKVCDHINNGLYLCYVCHRKIDTLPIAIGEYDVMALNIMRAIAILKYKHVNITNRPNYILYKYMYLKSSIVLGTLCWIKYASS